MAAINVTDLSNAKLDVDHIEEVANSLAATATDRLGNIKDTVKGAVDTLKAFNSRGAWVTATAYAVKDLVTNGGQWYACVTAHTSSASFATDSANWRVHQGVTSADLALSSASAGIGFIQAGTGAVAETTQSNARRLPHVKQFGAVGNGITDDTTKIAAALLAHQQLDFGGPENVYRVSAALALRDGHKLTATGASIQQITSNTEIFNTEGRSDITIRGLKFVGVGSDHSDSDSSRSVGVFGGTSGARIHITNCFFYNFGYTPARFKAQNDCSFTFNTVEGPGSPTLTPVTSGRNYGVLFDAGCQGVLIHGNSISKTAQGARVEQVRDCRITSNRFFDITGQHGVYAGSGITNLVIADNAVYNVDLIGIKVQAQDAALTDNINTTITGNSLYDCGDQGIMVCNGSGGATYKCRGVTITGNTVRLTTGSGIVINNTVAAIAADNVLDLCGFSGVTFSEASLLKISGNLIARSGLSAMRDIIACTQVSITGNKVQDCATAAAGTDQNGIFLQGGTEYVITDNEFGDTGAKMKYGIYLAGGTMGSFTVERNKVFQATDTGLRLASTAAMRSYKDNYWFGTLAATFNDPVLPSVTAAGTLVLPTNQRAVVITGATPVTFITPNGHSGQTVILFPDAGVDIRDGSNLLLNGNFLATAGDTLALTCDGTNWREVGPRTN